MAPVPAMTDLERARQLLADDPDEMDEAWLAGVIAAARREGAEAEREKVAMWMIERSIPTGHGDTVEDLLAEMRAAVAEEMRERAKDAIMNLRPVENMQEAAIEAVRALPLTPEEPT